MVAVNAPVAGESAVATFVAMVPAMLSRLPNQLGGVELLVAHPATVIPRMDERRSVTAALLRGLRFGSPVRIERFVPDVNLSRSCRRRWGDWLPGAGVSGC